MDVIYCAGGNKKLAEIAIAQGFLYGSRSDDIRDIRCNGMIDINWKNYNWINHLAAVEEHRPKYAVVPDIFDINELARLMEQAKSIEKLKSKVIIVPKAHKILENIPDNWVIGISVPSSYSGFLPNISEIKHRKFHGGSGWLPNSEIKAVLGKYWTENRVRELLKLGSGVFWEESGNGIVVYKVERLGKAIKCLPGHRVEIPLEAFSTLEKFRAFAYATYFAKASSKYGKDSGKSISRKIITELFGVADNTQKRYEDIAGFEVLRQYGMKKIPVFNPETMRYENEEEFIVCIKEKLKPGSWLWDVDKDGRPEIVQQLSNNYYVDTVFYKSNENKRVNNIGGDDQRYVAKPRLKLYHDDEKSLDQMVQKSNYQQEGYLYDKNISKKRKGRFHWIKNY